MSIPLPFPNINDTASNDVQTWSSSKILDYLKPALETEVTKTAEETGTEVTFNNVDPDTCEITKAVIEILPSQQGSGDPSPSNPRPLNSFSSLALEHTGKNFFDPSDYSSYKQADGSYSGLGSDFNSIYFYIPQELVGVQLTFSASIKIPEGSTIINPRVSARVNGTNTNGNAVTSNDYTLSSVTFTPTSTSDRLRITYGSNGSQPVQFKELLLEIGSTATAYEEHRTPEVHTLDLGSTVYGLTGDCVTGEFEETHKAITFNGSEGENWQKHTSGSSGAFAMKIEINDLFTGGMTDNTKIRSNYLKTIGTSAAWGSNDNWISKLSTQILVTGIQSITTVEDWKQYLSEHPLTVCYELATPAAITATPVTLDLFEGTNVFSCEPDGTVDIEITCTDTIGNILKKEGIL